MADHIVWDLRREAFIIPGVDFPIYWYSLWFAVGLYGAVVVIRRLLRGRGYALVGPAGVDLPAIDRYLERLTLFSFVGLVLGARLGHVLFYDWAQYSQSPIDILNFRQGGLSSHGAVLGLCFALWQFNTRTYDLPYLPRGRDLLDLVSIGSAWTAGCIRIGNFCNQEIVGTVSSLPWAVVFTSPLDAEGGVPRHPAQLYEAAAYFTIFALLLFIGRKGRWASRGVVTGWYLIATFSSRILIELVKVPQCAFDATYMHMGQLLSLPAVIIGIVLVIQGRSAQRKGQP